MLLLLIALPACHGGTRPPHVTLDGCPLHNLQASWASLQPSLPDANAAAQLIQAIACGIPAADPVAFISAHLDDTVTFVNSGAGELPDQIQVLPRSLAAAEVASYSGSSEYRYELSRRESGKLELVAESEGCVELVVLRHRASRNDWVVTRYESACD